MKHAIVHVALLVRDHDEAIAFYTQRLGFTLVEDRHQPGQAAFVGNQAGGRVFLFLSTDDLRRDYRWMTAAGVAFVRPPHVAPYGTVAVFEDLYGNRWGPAAGRHAHPGGHGRPHRGGARRRAPRAA